MGHLIHIENWIIHSIHNVLIIINFISCQTIAAKCLWRISCKTWELYLGDIVMLTVFKIWMSYLKIIYYCWLFVISFGQLLHVSQNCSQLCEIIVIMCWIGLKNSFTHDNIEKHSWISAYLITFYLHVKQIHVTFTLRSTRRYLLSEYLF